MKRRSTICLLTATIALAAGATAVAASVHVSATKAAQACSEGRAIGSKLGAADTAFLARYVPCVVKNERAQIGYGFRLSPAASRRVGAAMRYFFTLGYLSDHQFSRANRTILDRLTAIRRATCPKSDYGDQFADTVAPPRLTPEVVANFFVTDARKELGFMSGRAIFGIAVIHGALFRNRDRDAAAFGLVAVRCL